MKLYYDYPAKNWHESFPLGNGRLGACVYGGIKKEIIALNEDTLWSGYPEKTQKKLPKGYIEKVRNLVKNREYDKATKYVEECYQISEDVQMYLPFGNLCMEMLSEELIPPWFSNYTLNINTQMNYWQTGPCNLPEMEDPHVGKNKKWGTPSKITKSYVSSGRSRRNHKYNGRRYLSQSSLCPSTISD